jgi:hypothetical protein
MLPKIASITHDPMANDGTAFLNFLILLGLMLKAPLVSKITTEIPLMNKNTNSGLDKA